MMAPLSDWFLGESQDLFIHEAAQVFFHRYSCFSQFVFQLTFSSTCKCPSCYSGGSNWAQREIIVDIFRPVDFMAHILFLWIIPECLLPEWISEALSTHNARVSSLSYLSDTDTSTLVHWHWHWVMPECLHLATFLHSLAHALCKVCATVWDKIKSSTWNCTIFLCNPIKTATHSFITRFLLSLFQNHLSLPALHPKCKR